MRLVNGKRRGVERARAFGLTLGGGPPDVGRARLSVGGDAWERLDAGIDRLVVFDGPIVEVDEEPADPDGAYFFTVRDAATGAEREFTAVVERAELVAGQRAVVRFAEYPPSRPGYRPVINVLEVWLT